MIEQFVEQGIEKNIAIEKLEPGEYQPRHDFKPEALQELAASIQQVGILSRLIVRAKAPNRYEIIAGERRWRAAQLAGLYEVPCKIIQCDDEQALQIGLIENLARADLNVIEEARGIQRLMTEFNYTQEQAAECLGKARPTVANLLRLLALHKDVQRLIAQGELSESHGKILAALPATQQYAYAREAVIKKWTTRALEKAVAAQRKKTDSLFVKTENADVQRLQRCLSDYLAAAVTLQANSDNSGTLKINYNNLDELEGILARIGYKDESY